MTVSGPDDLAARLTRLVQSELGTDAGIANLMTMADGHAGLTFGFEVLGECEGAAVPYVLKIAPAGVPRRGSTDIYRQVPLLSALKSSDLPVPMVRWASKDDHPLGAPFIVMERLPGRTFIVWEPHESFGTDPAAIRSLWLQAGALLARFHRFDWRANLSAWEAPVALADELQRWAGILRHAPHPDWLASGTALLQALTAHIPESSPVGLVHGDFHPGNILYADGTATGVIDWDLASIGAQGMDVGWLMITADLKAWAADWKPICPLSPAEMLSAYRDNGGIALCDLEWFQAFAAWRIGAIACLNVKLHRNGKRHDPLWERFAPSVSILFARGLDLLDESSHPRHSRESGNPVQQDRAHLQASGFPPTRE